MRVSKSKFAKPVRKYANGGPTGITGFLNQSLGMPKAPTAGSAIGMGMDLLSGFIPQKEAQYVEGSGISSKSADRYNETVAKNQRTKQQISGGLSAAGDLAMMVPGWGTAVGLGLKGLGAVAKAIPFGKGKEQEAMHDFQRMTAMDNQISNAQQGAINYNQITGFQAPAYGRKGMKFKTKYSKNVKF